MWPSLIRVLVREFGSGNESISKVWWIATADGAELPNEEPILQRQS